ncbi:MAG: capsular polysaccharide biosynthesis protein CapF [Bacteroidales bacterium]|jgi:UDP-2-acetamido-2,6-beta-L-arabino-hexul-4-ose reductase|nr:capsular polysaccharide biosynthesis protein CapF [Bacteroidales bacterium]
MKILVTGSNGFIGRNLIAELANKGLNDVLCYDIDTDINLLDRYCKECEFVFHLAGINRPQNQEEFMQGNFDFTSSLLTNLKKHGNKAPVLITSSTQAALDNPYGKSKKAGEDLMFSYGKENEVKVFVYRLHNVFGKWCRPNYNSAVATFCHQIANDLPVTINDPNVDMNLVYIDDVIAEFIDCLNNRQSTNDKIMYISRVFSVKLGRIAEMLYDFKETRNSLQVPDMSDNFTKALYSTYLSYLPKEQFSYPLKMNIDHRGSFTEVLKSADRGQISVNISKPHIIKGNHWHHTKNEKFLVVSGKGVIRFRQINGDEIIEYYVSGDKLEVVDIPVGYTHNIENLGETDMVTLMWVNEIYDAQKPDTFFETV